MASTNEDPGFGWLLFSPSGRIGRQTYVMSFLLWVMLQGVAVSLMLTFENTSQAGLVLSTLALAIVSVAFFASFVMLTIKRLHDMGFAWMFVMLLFVPAVSLVAFVAFLFWPSAPPNQFGEHPNRPE